MNPMDLFNLVRNAAPPGSDRPGLFAPPPIDQMADDLAWTQFQNERDSDPASVPFIPDQAAGIQGQNTGDSFFNRLGQLGPNPFPIMHGKGEGILPILSLLAGFGNAMANRSGRQQQEKQKATSQATEAASKLATHRWRQFERKQKEQHDITLKNLEATQKARETEAETVPVKIGGKSYRVSPASYLAGGRAADSAARAARGEKRAERAEGRAVESADRAAAGSVRADSSQVRAGRAEARTVEEKKRTTGATLVKLDELKRMTSGLPKDPVGRDARKKAVLRWLQANPDVDNHPDAELIVRKAFGGQ